MPIRQIKGKLRDSGSVYKTVTFFSDSVQWFDKLLTQQSSNINAGHRNKVHKTLFHTYSLSKSVGSAFGRNTPYVIWADSQTTTEREGFPPFPPFFPLYRAAACGPVRCLWGMLKSIRFIL